jgi:hypothetical protein
MAWSVVKFKHLYQARGREIMRIRLLVNAAVHSFLKKFTPCRIEKGLVA